jgi:hypothetical protein
MLANYYAPDVVPTPCPLCGHDIDAHTVRFNSNVVVLDVADDGKTITLKLCDGAAPPRRIASASA